jgi:hypothetical protein
MPSVNNVAGVNGDVMTGVKEIDEIEAGQFQTSPQPYALQLHSR